MRVLGVDLGERRIGVAVSDGAGLVASPRCTIHRSGDPAADRAEVAAIAVEIGARRVVVGLPVSLDGRRGPAARSAGQEASALAELLEPQGVDVETFDERLTTVSAERRLVEAGRGGAARRRVIDQAAAAVMLQAWLDAHRSDDDA
ncbi:MAG: Holliday junction resolvase RuvX [Acidimicrobiales bacterium]